MLPLSLSSRVARTIAVAVIVVTSSAPTVGLAAASTPDRHAGITASDRANELAARAIAAMKKVQTVRSDGTWGIPASPATFTGVCVLHDPSALLSFRSAHRSWQIILISKPTQRDWERFKLGRAPWSAWQAQGTGPGDFNFPLLLPLACPRISLHDWRLHNVTLRFVVAAMTVVRGRPAWHLHAAVGVNRTGAQSTAVDWYVDTGTYRLLRRRFTQYAPTGKAGYFEDVTYFGVDSAAVIRPPATR